MNGKDRNVKKIRATGIRRACELRAKHSTKDEAAALVRKWFERKAYTKW